MKKFVIAILMIAPLSMNAQKFAHFNSADIISNMKEYVTATEEIQAIIDERDAKGEFVGKFHDQDQKLHLLLALILFYL